MRIAVATVQVPFVRGGAEVHAENLCRELKKRGYTAELVTMPFKPYPGEALIRSMEMGRMIDLSESDGQPIDRVIALKFPAFYLKHDHKVSWVLHQHRSAYDLWGTPYGDIEHWENGEQIREFIRSCDQKYLTESKKIFANSKNVAKRMMHYCGIESEPLYHPPLGYEKLRCDGYGDYVFYPSRINPSKRQDLLVDAAKYLRSGAKIVIAGGGTEDLVRALKKRIEDNGVADRVTYAGFITDEEKISYYANCLAVYFGTVDEDYGYITIEGMMSSKPVIVHPDAGGPLEFIENGENGCVVDAEAKALAAQIDALYENRQKTLLLGAAAKQTMVDLHLNWDYVIERLLSE